MTQNQASKPYTPPRQELLLEQILDTQKALLETEKKRLWTERYKLTAQTIKFIIILVFIWFSFAQLKLFTQSLWNKVSVVQQPIATGNQILNSANQAQEVLGGLGEITKLLIQ